MEREAERAAAKAAGEEGSDSESEEEEEEKVEASTPKLSLSAAGVTGVTVKQILFDALSSLFIACADVHGPVKFEAQETWKSIVPNSALLLKKIMPSVIPKIVGQLSSENEEHREVASAALGDLVGKLGENVMAQVS